jgi:hypothetical protein
VTYTESWELEPKNCDRLDCEVPRDVVQNNAESKRFQKVEESKDDPICEPLDVIMGTGAFNSLEGQVGGDTPTHKVGYRSSKGVERVKEDKKQQSTNNGVRLGNLGALLEIVQDWILGKLMSCVRL